jgi:hypothetical protein
MIQPVRGHFAGGLRLIGGSIEFSNAPSNRLLQKTNSGPEIANVAEEIAASINSFNRISQTNNDQ